MKKRFLTYNEKLFWIGVFLLLLVISAFIAIQTPEKTGKAVDGAVGSAKTISVTLSESPEYLILWPENKINLISEDLKYVITVKQVTKLRITFGITGAKSFEITVPVNQSQTFDLNNDNRDDLTVRYSKYELGSAAISMYKASQNKSINNSKETQASNLSKKTSSINLSVSKTEEPQVSQPIITPAIENSGKTQNVVKYSAIIFIIIIALSILIVASTKVLFPSRVPKIKSEPEGRLIDSMTYNKMQGSPLVGAIEANLQKGYSAAVIRDELVRAGWPENDIDEAFSAVLADNIKK